MKKMADKRKRGQNFTMAETDRLIQLLLGFPSHKTSEHIVTDSQEI